ncbi:Mitogen-activated protein kinase kinase kinase 21, putative [Theobroma cacao]|uniref:Mitogen-activated protein kinase kinase kinase 21, putative n=1 Tax=Theobroma cacao TaxID=3641 RepID=A0A061F8U6_THECC|nr:Mitogen-activated protein kinase kinase kinase 21, putative [Theobroma cacao]
MSSTKSGSKVATTGYSLTKDLTMEWIKLKTLGEGCFAVVDLVKIIQPMSCILAVKSSPFSCPSLSKEYKILQQFLGCPYIVQCYGAMMSLGYSEPYFNLFVEYAPEGNLLNLIQKFGGKIPESYVRCYIRMILGGLCDIHKRGYVHCDLKPENVLVYPSNQYGLFTLKIGDFGLAKEPEQSDAPKATPDPLPRFQGTPAYMSPESLRDGKITASIDIWSLGCVVLEMMTGTRPWTCTRNPKDLAKKIALTNDLPYIIPDNMSTEGKDFLMKCFARDPSERWTADMLINHPFLIPDSTLLAPQRSFLQDPLPDTSSCSERQPSFSSIRALF